MSEEKHTTKRINGHLHKLIPVKDGKGTILNYALKPLMVEFRLRDLLEVIVGATILAIPLAFTEETWVLGEVLPGRNVLYLGLISLLFIGFFVYFKFYRAEFKGHWVEYIKRVNGTYFFSLLVVALILTIIQKCPWGVDNALAIKRIIIVTFPASMSATISDSIK